MKSAGECGVGHGRHLRSVAMAFDPSFFSSAYRLDSDSQTLGVFKVSVKSQDQRSLEVQICL